MSNFNYFKVNKDFQQAGNEYELSICKNVEEVLNASGEDHVRRLVSPLKELYMSSRMYPRAIGRIEMYIDQNAHKHCDDIEFQWLADQFSYMITELYHI